VSDYEGVESEFADAAAIARYRASMLERSAPQADLIAPLLPEGARAVEVGCGNGRLLIELARRDRLVGALGLDLARSRIAFAEAWAAEEGFADRLRFAAADALAADIGTDLDAAFVITGALGYFGAARTDGALLARLADSLKPGGLLVLELYPHPGERRLLETTGGEARTWKELDAGDPWRFYLSHLHLREGVLTHAKTFVHRDDGRIDEGRSEQLFLYTPDSLTERLTGFTGVELREGWSEAPYAGGDVLVAIARRASAQ
jgi:SAM-dependent methyltransferase